MLMHSRSDAHGWTGSPTRWTAVYPSYAFQRAVESSTDIQKLHRLLLHKNQFIHAELLQARPLLLSKADVELVVSQSRIPYWLARKFLRMYNGDVVDAVMFGQLMHEPVPSCRDSDYTVYFGRRSPSPELVLNLRLNPEEELPSLESQSDSD